MNKRESTLGIDFGTSNTVVTYFDRDKFVNFNGENGEPYVKSVVAYNNDNKLIIDRGAHKLSNPAFRARNVKYLLGRNAKECEDVHDIPYEADIKYANEQPILVYKKKDKEISKTPEEVVTTFIKELKTRVERKVGRQFTNVVLTVPTTFRTKQKSALKKAARDAGLNVIGLYSEPTAAGVHYQLSLHTKSKGVFLVFDFGGGTLDLSLMYCKNNVYSTLASAGNYHLGGNDIDGKIVEYVEREYNTGGRPLFEGESDNVRRRKQKLCEAAEEVKIKLQGSDDTAIEVIEYEDDTGEPRMCIGFM